MDDGDLKFQQVYDEYYAKVYNYLKRMVGDAEVEDLTQEVFIKIGQALETFRGESQLSTWIHQIAKHAAFDRLRGARSRNDQTTAIEDGQEEKDRNIWTGEQAATTEQKMIRREMNGCIREVIDTLPDPYRTVIVLSEIEGLKDSEIAKIIGLSLQATKIRLHRARAKLKEALSKTCIFYRDEQDGFACDRKQDSPASPLPKRF
jgi:RNA polymerase sigma-70 factor (ECF subfamily)